MVLLVQLGFVPLASRKPSTSASPSREAMTLPSSA